MPLAAVIYNPIAGGSRGTAVSVVVERRLGSAGWQVERAATTDRRGAAPLAAEVADRVERVVVVGGDGTLREVIEGLGAARATVAVGVVPMGNANVVAHELGIPIDPEGAIDVAIGRHTVDMDVGRARTDSFDGLVLAVVGVGWDADTVQLLDRFRHTELGRRSYRLWADGLYGLAGSAAALRPHQPRFVVEVDGVPLPDGPFCAAFLCNLRTYGKRMAVTPDAHRASGRIHVQARRRSLAPFVLVQLVAAVAERRVPGSISAYADGTRVTVRGDDPFPVQVDGDPCGPTTCLEVEVLPGAVTMLAPLSKPSAARATDER